MTGPLGRYRSLVLFVLLAALWGGTYPAVEIGLESFSPVLYAAFRFDVAALVMLPYVVVTTSYWRPRTANDVLAIVFTGVLILGGYNVLLNVGQTLVPSAIAAILAGLIPIVTIGVSRAIVSKRQLGPIGVCGVLLGFVGVGLIARPSPSNLLSADTIGVAVLVLAAVSFALGSVLTNSTAAEIPTKAMMGWAMAVAALVAHVAGVLLPTESVVGIELTVEALIALAYLGLVSTVISYLIYFYLLPQLGSVEVNLVTYVEAAFGTLFSWLLFADSIGLFTLGGFLAIFAGFFLLKRDEIRREYERLRSPSRRDHGS